MRYAIRGIEDEGGEMKQEKVSKEEKENEERRRVSRWI